VPPLEMTCAVRAGDFSWSMIKRRWRRGCGRRS
jgi:hypothetical protein